MWWQCFLTQSIILRKVELKHTVEILHEEQERIVKIEAIKKSLEVEVKVGLLLLIRCEHF